MKLRGIRKKLCKKKGDFNIFYDKMGGYQIFVRENNESGGARALRYEFVSKPETLLTNLHLILSKF